jgi:hypothetical protein
VKEEVLKAVERLTRRGDWEAVPRYSVYLFYWYKSTNTDAEGACSTAGLTGAAAAAVGGVSRSEGPSAESDSGALQALIDDSLVEMEKQWLRYEEEEDAVCVAVADALLDDLLYDITAQLVE